MKRTLLKQIPDSFPSDILKFIGNAKVFDSSCSPEARVYFVDKDCGYYLKCAPEHSLEKEAKMTEYFHRKGLGAEVLCYKTYENDWLITSKVRGEDCTDEMYLSEPKRLCDTLALKLRELHEMSFDGCPILTHTESYIKTVEENYKSGNYDTSHFPDSFGYSSATEAYSVFQYGKSALKSDTLLHGDYCLPNVLLDNWEFSGFIDVGNGGVGDRHVDLFWGTWTLWFNLKTDIYKGRFLDAYGRDKADEDFLKIIAAAEVFG